MKQLKEAEVWAAIKEIEELALMTHSGNIVAAVGCSLAWLEQGCR
jgi:hypothetical protein